MKNYLVVNQIRLDKIFLRVANTLAYYTEEKKSRGKTVYERRTKNQPSKKVKSIHRTTELPM
jgi:hypothetical protein